MNRTSTAAASLLFIACAPATPPPPADEPAPVPPLASIEGLPLAEDEDANPDDKVVEYSLTVGVAEQEILPGEMTSMWTYNGTSPGPVLRARVGDTVKIHVTNTLAEATTIHWHGLRVDWRQDGVVHDSEDPSQMVRSIQPGETFTYELVPPDAGTFWYHPHVRGEVQVEAGLYGAFVVQEAEDARPDVDADRLFMLDDVRLAEDGSIAPESGGMDIMHGRAGNVLLVNGSSDVASLALGRGQVERWRFTNSSNARTFELAFPGLEVREIGADGGLWPQRMSRTIEQLVVPVGARAELEVRLAEGAESGSLDALVLVQDMQGNVVTQPMALAEVTHDAALDTDAPRAGHFADPAFTRIDEATPVTHDIVISAANDALGFRFTINGKAWPDLDAWHVEANKLQVIRIKNEIGPYHPFHLHGQFFQVLTRAGLGAWESGWRDTVLVDGFEEVVVATYFDNPGHWMYHCHVLEHAQYGMMAMLEVSEPESMEMSGH